MQKMQKNKTLPSIYHENGYHQRRIAGNESAELPVAAQSSSCMPLEQRSDFQKLLHFPEQINEMWRPFIITGY